MIPLVSLQRLPKKCCETLSILAYNIPVETNGVFVYSPAVQRLLQLSANIYDAATTNFYPTVFRPVFNRDTSGNVFITGYQQVAGVYGANDPQLALPIDVSALPTGISSNLNVYGVPWIIGAKKGFPNFNELSMESIVQTTRKLQVTRTVTNMPPQAPQYQTNQMYIFNMNNWIGVECLNSYSNNYPNPVQIVLYDNLWMTLTNNLVILVTSNYVISVSTNVTLWQGSIWDNNSALDSESFHHSAPDQCCFHAGLRLFIWISEFYSCKSKSPLGNKSCSKSFRAAAFWFGDLESVSVVHA